MQAIITAEQESTVPDSAALVGIDTEGRVHYFMAGKAHDERVFVATDDGVDVYDLADTGRGLEDWIAHVDGWETKHYGETFEEMLADSGLEAGA